MFARGWYWWLDYVYVVLRQLRSVVDRHPVSSYADGDLAPVLLLPGVYEPWQFLRPIADRLHALGHPVHIVTGLGYNRSSVRDAAALAQRSLELGDLRGVVIVAHSKGGLIGKHMMVVDDLAAGGNRIDAMVAIATPFGGSRYARYFLNRTIRAFSPTEATLVMLAAQGEANSRITSVFGTFDPHIPEGSRLEGASNIEIDVSGHFRLLSDERVLVAVEQALGHPAGVD